MLTKEYGEVRRALNGCRQGSEVSMALGHPERANRKGGDSMHGSSAQLLQWEVCVRYGRYG